MAVNTTHTAPRFIGEIKDTEMNVESATVIYAGDAICSKDSTTNDFYAVVPNDLADGGDAAANREVVGDLFRGIAIGGSANGDTGKIRVATFPTQIWLKQQTAAAIYENDPVEPYCDDDNTLTPNNTYVAGTTSQVAKCISTKTSTTDPWFKAQLLPTKIGLETTAQG